MQCAEWSQFMVSYMYFFGNLTRLKNYSRPAGAGCMLAAYSGSVQARVVSLEISRNFPRKISGNLFQSFRKFQEIC